MDFSKALSLLKEGKAIEREGWNGKGQYLKLQKTGPSNKMTLPYIYINIPCQNCAEAGEKPSGFNLVPWLASQTDLLADDYKIVLSV